MPTITPTGRLTRRGFVGWGVGAAASLGVLGNANASEIGHVAGEKPDTTTPDFVRIKEKIALEEHFSIPETVDNSYAAHRGADVLRLIGEIGPERIAEMDRGGVEIC